MPLTSLKVAVVSNSLDASRPVNNLSANHGSGTTQGLLWNTMANCGDRNYGDSALNPDPTTHRTSTYPSPSSSRCRTSGQR
jgi:hypothetical protein